MEANREYHRARRERIRAEAADNVTALPVRRTGVPASARGGQSRRSEAEKGCGTTVPEQPVEPGETELAVLEECRSLSLAEQRPAMVATAQRMARILDNQSLTALWPTTSRQLTAILNDLRGGSRSKRKGRLSSVQSMTNRKAAK